MQASLENTHHYGMTEVLGTNSRCLLKGAVSLKDIKYND